MSLPTFSRRPIPRAKSQLALGLVPKDFNGSTLSAPQPTDALPGSADKVRVLIARRQMGLDLWHPLDAQLPTNKAMLVSRDNFGGTIVDAIIEETLEWHETARPGKARQRAIAE
jgi:hypothetical protein